MDVPPQTTLNIRSTIDSSETLIREVISEINISNFHHPKNYDELSLLSIQFVDFVERQSERVHSELVLVSNILEDCLRTIFIVNEDATLEGFATELETQLGQLRLLAEGLKDLPVECNERLGDILSGWNDRLLVILKTREIKTKMDFPEDTSLEISTLQRLSLYNAAYLSFQNSLKTLRESCIKVLSVLSMVAGKWEKNIEERVDDEDIREGMVMTAGSGIRRGSRAKGRQVRKNNIYY